MIAGAISLVFAVVLVGTVVTQHPIPVAPVPPCASGYLVPFRDAMRCVDRLEAGGSDDYAPLPMRAGR